MGETLQVITHVWPIIVNYLKSGFRLASNQLSEKWWILGRSEFGLKRIDTNKLNTCSTYIACAKYLVYINKLGKYKRNI